MAVTVVLPFAIAVTRPAASTLATESSLDHSNCAVATPCPFESNASAAIRTVSPIAKSATESGSSRTCATLCSTVTSALAVSDAVVTVTCALPFATAVASPSVSTVTTDSSSDDHTNSAPVTTCPFPSRASATNRAVSPIATSVWAAGDTTNSATNCSTTTSALAVAGPAAAVTIALPLPTAMTSPPVTVATAVSLLLHMTVTLVIAWPYWSLTVAISRTLSPNERNAAEVGEIATMVGTGGSGATGVIGSSPQAMTAPTTAAARANARARKPNDGLAWRSVGSLSEETGPAGS